MLARHVDLDAALHLNLARVLPDGCMDILVALGDFPRPLDSADLAPHRAFVVGTMTRQQLFVLEGRVDMVAIRFKPAFRLIFEVATTRGGNGIVLINETPPDPEGQRLNHCVLGGDGGESPSQKSNA